MKLIVTINMDNAAFEDNGGTETARILRELSDTLDGWLNPREKWSKPLVDINGNRVGEAKVTR